MSNELALETPKRKAGAFEKRVHEIDFIRGALIIIVLIDHILNAFLLHTYDWYIITGNSFWLDFYHAMRFYWDCVARQTIRPLCLIAFCFISGISCAFSRNNWKRMGEEVLIYGLIAVGSNFLQAWHWFGDTIMIIDFNIIGVLAFSTLFYCFVQNCSWKGILAATLWWFLFSTYGMRVINAIPGSEYARVPSLIEPTFWTADWMPLVPYIFFFFLGGLFSYFFYQDKKSKFKRYNWERPVCFAGRYTLYIYLGHQVILFPIFMAITAIMRASYGM